MNKTICSTLLTILLLAFGCSSTKPVTQMCRVDEAALVEFAKQKIKEKMPEVDLPAVIIDGMPQYSDGAIRTVTVGDVTNRLDDRYPVKNLCFNKGATNQIQMVWGGDRMPPPIMLESNQVYRFEFGCKKITDGGPDTKRGQSIFATVNTN